MAAENTGKLIEGTVAEKTHKMCQNVKTVLEAAGSGLERVVKVTVSCPTLLLFFNTLGMRNSFGDLIVVFWGHGGCGR